MGVLWHSGGIITEEVICFTRVTLEYVIRPGRSVGNLTLNFRYLNKKGVNETP